MSSLVELANNQQPAAAAAPEVSEHRNAGADF